MTHSPSPHFLSHLLLWPRAFTLNVELLLTSSVFAVISQHWVSVMSQRGAKSPAHLLVSVDEVQPMTGKLSYSRRS